MNCAYIIIQIKLYIIYCVKHDNYMTGIGLSSSCKDHKATLLLYILFTLYRLGLGLRLGNI